MRQTGFSVVVKAIIRDRADGCCELCGEYSSSMEQHHRRCRGMGSTRRPETNMPGNGLLLCAACHRHVESHRSEAYVNGWLVRQGQVPADIPVLRRGELVLLDDLGGVTPVAAEDIPGIERGIDLVKLDNKNGPGPSVATPGEFPDLTTMEGG